MRINTIKKDYGQVVKILRYNHSIDINPPTCKVHQIISCVICFTRKPNAQPSQSSLQRSKTTITDYVIANNFSHFCTFTFNPEKVDSFDIELAKSKFSTWLWSQRYHSPEFQYLWVAELHKSGRIHFHALFNNYQGILTPTKRSQGGREIFNISNWNYGFSTAVVIDDISKVATYMQKYITKDMLKITNKRRFATSKNLKKPTKTYNIDVRTEIFDLPLMVKSVHRGENYKLYTIIK